ncbi:MAG: 16S rRNA (uracil(1498)-N(3))-methyltransferase [Acidobacteria bacterium]|nr:16S rRNA (uracil(1498)-N(3))-methyltransferase [Acidobacteriota bacterium]MCA1611485.1 16S rRNA (uracil(1498)-N(3))-methyltransferase [Acidobacteriota bacterium]
MSRPRFIVPALPAAGERVSLPEEERRHLRSRRIAPGDAVVLIDGTGAEADAEILPGSPGAPVLAGILEVRPGKERDSAVWLGVCAVRPERLAWVAEKAGELGVARLAIVLSERAQSFRGGPGTVARLDRLAREAAKQSGETRWMQCEGPVTFAHALASAPGAFRGLIDFSGEDFPRSGIPDSAALLLGPEGGWTPAELDAARSAKWRSLRLPTPTLRTETAAIAALVLTRAGMREPVRFLSEPGAES